MRSSVEYVASNIFYNLCIFVISVQNSNIHLF